MTHTGLKPDIQDIVLFLKPASFAARAGRSFRQKFFGRSGEPEVAATLLFYLVRDMIYNLGIGERFFAVQAGERYDRHPPGPLPGDAPVRAVHDHSIDPVPSPFRDPGHVPVNLVEGAASQIVLRSEE